MTGVETKLSREKHVLSNGLRVILERRPSVLSVGMSCVVQAGSRDDYPEQNGLAHCVEHLLFKTDSGQDKESLFAVLGDHGCEIYAATALDQTLFSLRCLSEDLTACIDAFGRIVADLTLSDDIVKAEKDVIAEELSLTGEDAAKAFQRVKFGMLGGDESLQHALGGKTSFVKKITAEDAQKFYAEFYTAENMVLSLVGDFETDVVLAQLERAFSGIRAGDQGHERPALTATGPKMKVLPSGGTHSYISFFFRTPSMTSTKLAALEMLNDYFAAGSHSRLFMRLREENALVYSAGGVLDLMQDFGTLDIHVPTRQGNVRKVVHLILDEIDMIRTQGFSEEMLKEIRRNLVKGTLLSFDNVSEAATWYARRELLSSRDNADEIAAWVSEVESVTALELTHLALEIFSPQNTFLYLIGFLWPWHRKALKRRLEKASISTKVLA